MGTGGVWEGAHPAQTVLQLSGRGAAITKGKFTLDRMRFFEKSVTFFFLVARRPEKSFLH